MALETYGRYELLRSLASGGMAQIFLARQRGLEGIPELVVVKRILPHLAEHPDFITMFLDEARIVARLSHPNVVQVFDLGAREDTLFIAMEYIHGEDVRRVWKRADARGEPIPVPLACRIVIDACLGLDSAHKTADAAGRPLNIVHRDVSPQNILVGFDGQVKVVDFGIAKAADQRTVTGVGVLKGKCSYMSPEQARGAPVDHRTDVFALGVVLHELLTRQRLFKAANELETLRSVIECRVAPPSAAAPHVPKALDRIVLKAVARDRDARYPEARLLAADLEEWLAEQGQPASAGELAAFLRRIYGSGPADARPPEERSARLTVGLLPVTSASSAAVARGFDCAKCGKRTPFAEGHATGAGLVCAACVPQVAPDRPAPSRLGELFDFFSRLLDF